MTIRRDRPLHRLWPYAATVALLAAVVPVLPIDAGATGARLRFVLVLPLALGAVAALAAVRHPTLGAVWIVPAAAVIAVGASALAYSARGILEILAVTFVLSLVGSVCGAGWTRLGAAGTEERTKP